MLLIVSIYIYIFFKAKVSFSLDAYPISFHLLEKKRRDWFGETSKKNSHLQLRTGIFQCHALLLNCSQNQVHITLWSQGLGGGARVPWGSTWLCHYVNQILKVEGTHPNIRLTNSLWRNSLHLGGVGDASGMFQLYVGAFLFPEVPCNALLA